MLETNIIVIHDQTPQISLPHSSFLRSRCSRSRRHDDADVFFFFFSFFFFLSRRVSLRVLFVCVFRPKRKIGVLAGKEKKKEFPKHTIIEALGARGRSSHKSWLFPSRNQNRVVVIRDAEEVVVRFLSSERSVLGVQRVLKTHHVRERPSTASSKRIRWKERTTRRSDLLGPIRPVPRRARGREQQQPLVRRGRIESVRGRRRQRGCR